MTYRSLELTERQWQAQVLEAARVLEWLIYHTYDSRRSEPGFPDLMLLKGTRLVVAEVKTQKGRLNFAQEVWLEAFRATNAEVYVWRPDDWPEVERVLKGESRGEIVVKEIA